MAYRYLGSATTNANGVAELNFTGTGRGKLDIVASTSNPPTSGSLVSETYELLDAIVTDSCTTAEDKLSYWSADTTHVDYDRDSSGMSIVSKNNGLSSNLIKFPSASSVNCYNPDVAVEFTVLSATGNIRVQAVDSTNMNRWFDLTNLGNTPKQIRLEYTGHIMTPYIDNQSQSTINNTNQSSGQPTTSSLNNFSWGFRIENGSSLKIANLRIYPI